MTISCKINRMITVDPEIWDKFQRLFPNKASSYCNEQMRLRLAYSQGDLTNVDIEILQVQEREALQELDLANSKLAGVREKLSLIKAEADKEEKIRLQEEKQRIESLSECGGCGKQMVKSHIKAGGGQFCKECFYNEHPKLMSALKKD